MKIRKGFVSNSSSSSFIIKAENSDLVDAECELEHDGIKLEEMIHYIKNVTGYEEHHFDRIKFVSLKKWFEFFEKNDVFLKMPKQTKTFLIKYAEVKENCYSTNDFKEKFKIQDALEHKIIELLKKKYSDETFKVYRGYDDWLGEFERSQEDILNDSYSELPDNILKIYSNDH